MYFRSKIKINASIFLHFPHLIVPLDKVLPFENANKCKHFFAFPSLNRTFVPK